MLMRSLVDMGFDKVARVGDLDKIKPCLLPYSVQYKGGSGEQGKKLKVSVSSVTTLAFPSLIRVNFG